jgi:phosphatidylglycerophosphate synthase
VIGSMTADRRALSTRDAWWTKTLAHQLARAGVRPNTVSIASVAFAAAASVAFAAVPHGAPASAAIALMAAAASIQLRLLCNLLDGMLAVEEGLKTPAGEIFNDLPDRISDVLVLVGAGWAVHDVTYGQTLGWLAALLALLTAYVRVLGGSLGARQTFDGPMAKQHRMFTLTVASLAAAVEVTLELPPRFLVAGLLAIVIGSTATVIRRVRLILREVNQR